MPIYEPVDEDAAGNKKEKWNSIFKTARCLKCKGEKDIKDVKIFQICKTGCDYTALYNEDESDIHAEVYDEMFIGRVQVNMNDGKKRRFLYFTADYTLK
jgi:hypothetical protein